MSFIVLNIFVIINPSMDCNLKCWYCYENHIANSMMSFETADKIISHIKLHFQSTNFKKIYLSFFWRRAVIEQKSNSFYCRKNKRICLGE